MLQSDKLKTWHNVRDISMFKLALYQLIKPSSLKSLDGTLTDYI